MSTDTSPLTEQDRRALDPVVAVLGTPWQVDDWGHCNYVITRYDALDGEHFGASVAGDPLRWNAGIGGMGTEEGPVVADASDVQVAAWIVSTFVRLTAEDDDEGATS